MNKFDWKEKQTAGDGSAARIADQFRIPPAGARFLESRGLTENNAVHAYLDPSPRDAGDPLAFDNMAPAVALVEKTIKEKRPILIHGDYDVDGISGTALLYNYLDGIFEKIFRFLPDRRKDGYGIADRAVDWALENNVGLVITVDCGTADGELLGKLISAGVDVIVCDHHEFPINETTSGVMLNPVRPGESYPHRTLCGAGVAYKFIEALHKCGIRGDKPPDSQIDLLALATVADVMPLTGENRYYVRAGLDAMNRSPRSAVEAIKGYSRLGSKTITSGHISFIFAPRLNAPGRVGNPKPSLEILCTGDPDEARRLASVLEYDNERRKELTAIASNDAVDRVKDLESSGSFGGYVLAAEHWDEGVLGIAAARVAETYGKPAVLLTVSDGIAKGSGRSVRGVDLKKHMDRLSGHFVRYGGHSQAVGVTMEAGRVESFASELSENLKEDIAPDISAPPLEIDAAITLGECSIELANFLALCEPFGYGNKEPVWKIADVQVSTQTTLVGDNHLKLFFQDTDTNIHGNAIAFGWDRPETPEDLHMRSVDVAVKIKKGHYMGRDYVELRLVDIRDHKD